MTSSNKLIAVIALVTATFSLLPLPYGFYSITRIIFTVIYAHVAYKLFESDRLSWLVFLGFVILYNPIFPIHLGDKHLWSLINFVGVGLLFWLLNDRHSERELL
jgi:hypothetical protein